MLTKPWIDILHEDMRVELLWKEFEMFLKRNTKNNCYNVDIYNCHKGYEQQTLTERIKSIIRTKPTCMVYFFILLRVLLKIKCDEQREKGKWLKFVEIGLNGNI